MQPGSWDDCWETGFGSSMGTFPGRNGLHFKEQGAALQSGGRLLDEKETFQSESARRAINHLKFTGGR